MNILHIELFELWEKLSSFVREICGNREENHGHKHMKTVAISSLNLFLMEHENKFKNDITDFETIKNILIVAWLHDVADHKYDKNGELKEKVNKFLNEITDKPNLIMNIIDRISYSREAKSIENGEKLDWNETLGDYGCFVRNIVSDADKLEALGKVGFQRCLEYTKNNYRELYNKEIDYELLKQKILIHANDKLLKLKDYYIKTNIGKELAKNLHNELVDELNKCKF